MKQVKSKMCPKWKVNKDTSPIFIDTGPLLLLLIGIYDKELIGSAKRVNKYKQIHFDLLFRFLVRRKVLVTPGILAEVSNFSKQVVGSKKFNEFVKSNLEDLRSLGECHISKDIIIETDEFLRFGYTDASILLAIRENRASIITDDYPLYSKCKKIGINCTHINMLEELADTLE